MSLLCVICRLDVVIILELLSKLSHIVQLSNVNKMTTQLDHAIQQYLPFGRASGYHHLELLTAKPSSQSKGMWSMRSKPRLDIQIKEEVRMVTSSVITVAELYGTVYATTVDAEGDYSGMNLNLQFSKLADLPTMLFHPSAVVKNDGSNTLLRVKHPERMTFQLCHYTFSLETPPIQAVLKIRSGESTSSSIYIQLHIASGSLRSSLSRLEVRLPVPSGGSIVRILTPPAQVMGAVSLQRDGTILLWNLTPLAASASSGSKLKEDMVLNIDVELSGPLSLAESEATVIHVCPLQFGQRCLASPLFLSSQVLFTSTATTVSGLNVSLVQPSDIKIAQSKERVALLSSKSLLILPIFIALMCTTGFEVKNSSYRVCNHRTAGMSNRQVSKD